MESKAKQSVSKSQQDINSSKHTSSSKSRSKSQRKWKKLIVFLIFCGYKENGRYSGRI